MARAKTSILQLHHQKEGTTFLRKNAHAGLFDEQGLGKSKQVIDAVAAEIEAGSIKGAVIVCPNGLKTNWVAEIQKFSSLTHALFGSGRAARRGAFAAMRASFYIMNYEAVPAELPSLRALIKFKPMALILDESHRIKTPGAKVTRAIHDLRIHASRRYILSGTPVANKPEDLWSQMFFLDDGKSLGVTFKHFEKAYKAGKSGYRAMDEMRDRIAPSTLRRTKDKALNLPPKTYTRIPVELSSAQLAMYERMREDLELWVRNLSGAQVLEAADAILARLVRLAQLASNPKLIDVAYGEVPAKLITLDGLLKKYFRTRDRKLIIWTSFVDNIRSLLVRYERFKPVAIYGHINNATRDKAVRAFMTDPAVRLLIANPAAAREGLTLTEANVAIYMDRTFNLVDYLQSQDRIHRISQTKPCEIVLLVARNTVDEFIDFSLEQKHRLARFAQSDTDQISAADLALSKPNVLRALLAPTGNGVSKRKSKRTSGAGQGLGAGSRPARKPQRAAARSKLTVQAG
jgi:SWI/SNF-related matrix-associated actin-dependent regulator of chromatin subfamily A-like protein 1